MIRTYCINSETFCIEPVLCDSIANMGRIIFFPRIEFIKLFSLSKEEMKSIYEKLLATVKGDFYIAAALFDDKTGLATPSEYHIESYDEDTRTKIPISKVYKMGELN